MASHMVRTSSAATLPAPSAWPCVLVGLGLLAASVGCRRSSPAAHAVEPMAPARRAPSAVSANRCGECHPATEREWRGSAHARGATSPLFVAMRKAAGAANCNVCHAPLGAVLSPSDPVIGEGVSCDVCHTIRDVKEGEPGDRFALQLTDAVKYGPLCDAQDHYFHRMGCSPLHEQSRLCAACHQYRRPLPGGGELPVYTEFAEWLASPFSAGDQVCQDCHMPGSLGAAAVGSPETRLVPHHGWLGAKGDLRQRALRGGAEVTVAGDRIRINVTLANRGAGHNVPTGSPERRLVLRVFTLDGALSELDGEERQYGRFLVDAAGAPAPFFSASRVDRDNRLRPGEERPEMVELPMTKARKLRVEVVWWRCDPVVTARWLPGGCDHEILLAGEADLSPSRARRTIRLKPPESK